jgi:phosphate:Na+ symporter
LEYVASLLRIIGSVSLFLYGVKLTSDGIQLVAGERMQKVINFMTGNRLMGVVTGIVVTALVQSSSATTVMVVSFVNAGILTLTQSIGVIMGANIGTTITAWIISLVGFSVNLPALALPIIGIGFTMQVIKWKHHDLGAIFMGFGLLFLGLDFLTKSMPDINISSFPFIAQIPDESISSLFIGIGLGLIATLFAHSSSATTAIIITMAHNGTIDFPFAAAMVLGANIGTTVDAALAAIGTKTAAKRAALVHILFNVIGTIWAIIFFRPLLWLVNTVTPGTMDGAGIALHLAMIHTVFNTLNTLLFFPFVKPFARLISFLIKDPVVKETLDIETYRLDYTSSTIQDTPELNIIRAEKEIRDLAGVASSMYQTISSALYHVPEKTDAEKASFVDSLVKQLERQENYADEMRIELTHFLIECTRQQLSQRSEGIVTQLLRIVADLEEMTDECFAISRLLERSVKKNLVFKPNEMEALRPYLKLVDDFLGFVCSHLGTPLNKEQSKEVYERERAIMEFRDQLHKMGRKRIEAGEDVKTELLFIDLVRLIEKLGDFCYNIAEAMNRGDRVLVQW